MSIQSGTSPGAIISAGSTPAAGGVTSVFGRSGAVVAVAGDYTSSQITNASAVVGATVTDALNTLDAGKAELTSTPPVNVTKSAAVVGVGTTAARHDHKHDISTAAAVSISTANTEGTATTLARSDHTHIGVASFIGRTGAVVAVAGDYTSSLNTNSSSVPGATVTAALDAAGTYYWVWADAAARLAQAVTAAQVGAIGFQTDMAMAHRLISNTGGFSGGARWAPIPDPAIIFPRFVEGFVNSNVVWGGLGIAWAGQSGGTLTARSPTNTSNSMRRIRTGYVTAASPAAALVARETGGLAPPHFGGLRIKYSFVTFCNTPSANWQWFAGCNRTSWAGVVVPSSAANILGIGIDSADSNLQIMRSAAAETATKTNLGSGFPARTTDNGYFLDIYTADASVNYVVQVGNMNTQEEISFTFTTHIPDQLGTMLNSLYVNTGGDSISVGLDFVGLTYGQIVK